ncbi:MAG: 16S rRNA (adenine(1518)-N(6)/adenine(1519)-N(6))-dimethyltransferase RsmA [Planctomycetota bacterium]
MEFVPRREILAALAARGFRAKPTRGQNFLFDPQLLSSFLADADVRPGERVLEVGPGAGTLTRFLLAAGCVVTAVELDDTLCAYLREELDSPRFELIAGDVLRSKSSLSEELLRRVDSWGPFRLIANLPYSIATSLVQLLIEQAPRFEGFGVLVQKEVAARWLAHPGARDYSAISVLLSACGRGRITRAVGRQMFTPAPRVDSSFAVWSRTPGTSFEEFAATHRWSRYLFGHRRKMLRSLLAPFLAPNDGAWGELAIDPCARPEALDPTEFRRLADELGRRGLEAPRPE